MSHLKRLLTLGLLAFAALGISQAPNLVVQTTHPRTSGRVAVSNDHNYLATADDDGTVKIWSVDSGLLLRTLELETGIRQIGFDSKGHLIVAGPEKVLFIEPSTGAEVSSLKAKRILCTSFDSVGNVFVTGDTAQTVKVWDPGDGTMKRTLVTMKDVVRNVRLSLDKKTLAVVTQDGELNLLEYPSAKKLGTIAGVAIDTSLDFSPDSKLLAAKTSTGGVVIRVSTRKAVATLSQSLARRDPLMFGEDGNLYMRTGISISRFSPSEGGQGETVFGAITSLLDFRISGDRQIGLVTRLDDSVELYDLSKGTLLGKARGLTGAVNALASSGRYAATGADDGWVHLWDAGTGRPVASVLASPGGVSGIAFTGDGTRLLSVGSDGSLHIWALPSLAAVREIQISSLPLRAVAASPTTNKVAIIGYHGELFAGEPDGTFAEVANLGPEGRYLTFTPDGTGVAAAKGVGNFVIVPLDSGVLKESDDAHQAAITFIGFSKDGTRWVTAGLDGAVKFWHVGESKPTSTVQLASSVFTGAMSPDRSMVAIGGWVQPVAIFDMASGSKKAELSGESKNTRAIVYSADGTKLLSGGRDGATEVWNVTKNALIAKRYAIANRNWVVVDSKGRFDGTDQGLKALHYIQDNKPLPLDGFFEQFDVPDLYAALTGAKVDPNDSQPAKPPPDPKIDITKKLLPPPTVRITTPSSNITVDQEATEVVVQAIDEGGGVDQISLYQNGKLVSNAQRGMVEINRSEAGKYSMKFNVLLAPGENVFTASAYNKDRTESAPPKEVKITLSQAQAASTLYVLSVGINDYVNDSYDLTFAKGDAQAFAANLQAQGSTIFKKVEVVQILDKLATRPNIEKAFADISAKAKPGDVFVFFYSGHGLVTEPDDGTQGQFYIITSNVTKMLGSPDLDKLGISAPRLRDLCMAVPAQKQLIIFDACYSGGAVTAFKSRGAAGEKAIHQLSRSTGVAVLAASSPQQTATEVKALGHGVFTYAILKGLAGEAAPGSGSRKVTVGGLFAYLNDIVPELTKQYRGKAQFPDTFLSGQDFPIVVTKG